MLEGINKKFVGPLLVALGSLLWATDAPVRYPLAQRVQSGVIVLAEHIVGLLLSIPILLQNKNYRVLSSFAKKHWIALIFISLGGSVIASIAFTQAFAIGNPTVVILTQKIQPVIAILMAAVILKEKIIRKRSFWILALVAIVAVYFVSFGDATYGEPLVNLFQPATYLNPFFLIPGESAFAFGLALVAAFFWGGSTVFGRVILEKVDFKVMTALRYAFASLWLLLLVTGTGVFGNFLALDFNAVLSIIYIGVVPGFLALFVYYMGLKSTKASVATLSELVFPVAATVINWQVLGFSLTLTQLIGVIVLLASITLLSRENAKSD
jgi:drug/metabolite transporter (DMT)-like permease